MRVSIIISAILLFMVPVAAWAAPAIPAIKSVYQADQNIHKVARQCGWWSVFQCSRSYRGAKKANKYGYVIKTNSVRGFRKGWYCAVHGPFGEKATARYDARKAGGYIKWGCNR